MSYSGEVLADSPVGYWRQDDTSGTALVDSAAGGHNGVLHNSPTLSQTGAITSDGTNLAINYPAGTTPSQYADVAYFAALNTGAALTIEFWLKLSSAPTGAKFVVLKSFTSHADPYYQYGVGILTGNIRVVINQGNSFGDIGSLFPWDTGVAYLTDGAWHHYVLTFDKTLVTNKANVYIDKVLQASSGVLGSLVNDISAYSTPLSLMMIENLAADQAYAFAGVLDEVAVYNTALTPTRITAHYDAASGPPPDSGQSTTTISTVSEGERDADTGQSTTTITTSGAAEGIDAGTSSLQVTTAAGGPTGAEDSGRSTATITTAGTATHSDSGVSVINIIGAGETEREISPVLGCGTYEIAILTRGGHHIVGFIPWTTLNWGRQLDDTSSAAVSLQEVSGQGDDCCLILSQVRPWKHELGFYRNGERVWVGPIVQATFKGDGVTIDARDLSAWWDKRKIHKNHDFSNAQETTPTPGEGGQGLGFVDLATLFQVYADDAMEPDNSPGLCVVASPIGVLAERNVLAAQHLMAGPLLREIARAGIDWTVVDRDVMAGGAIVPTDPLPTLVDGSFAGQPLVRLDGQTQTNDPGVRGAGVGEAGDALYAEARDGDSITESGLLEDEATESGLTDRASVRLAAESRLDMLSVPVGVIEEGVLDADVGIPVGMLVPGAPVPVRLYRTCLPVSGDYRLSFVKVDATASETGGTESVQVGFIPKGGVVTPAGETPPPPPIGPPPDPSALPGPILWLRCGELTGDLFDYSGHHHPATVAAGTQGTLARDDASLAYPLDGSITLDALHTYPWLTQYPDVQIQPNFGVAGDAGFWPWNNNGNPWTIMATIEQLGAEVSGGNNVDQGLIGCMAPNPSGGHLGFALWWEGINERLHFGNPSLTQITYDVPGDGLVNGTVTVTYSGNPDQTVKVYIDDVLVMSGSFPVVGTNSGALGFGAVDFNLLFSGGYMYSKAGWDEVIAWDRELSAAEIAIHNAANHYWQDNPPADLPPDKSARWEVAQRTAPTGTFTVESDVWTPVPLNLANLWRQDETTPLHVVADDEGYFAGVVDGQIKVPVTGRYFYVLGRVGLDTPRVLPITSRRGCRLVKKPSNDVVCSYLELAGLADEQGYPGQNTFGPDGLYSCVDGGSAIFGHFTAGTVLELQVWQDTGGMVTMHLGDPSWALGTNSNAGLAWFIIARYYA